MSGRLARAGCLVMIAGGTSLPWAATARAQTEPATPTPAQPAPPTAPLPAPTPAPVNQPSNTTIVLRGGETPPAPEVVGLSSMGVTVGGTVSGNAKPVAVVMIGWDRVKELRGPLAEQAREHMGVADQVWRARRRLERGDAPAAEPLFEQVFSLYKGKPGPTSAVIAEGLLRCRLRRGAHLLAIEPWLAMLAAQARDPNGAAAYKPEWSQDAGMAPILDSSTGLLPAVPPIWLGWDSLRGFAANSDRPAIETKPGALMALYQTAAAFEIGASVEFPRSLPQDPGVLFVAMIVRARTGTVEQRATARKQLEDRVRTASAPWMEAWARSAIGRSLLMELDPNQQRLGVIELLHLPARFSQSHPYLAGAALAEASVKLEQLGDAEGARVLRRELADQYANHPALDWIPIRTALARDGYLGAPQASPTPMIVPEKPDATAGPDEPSDTPPR